MTLTQAQRKYEDAIELKLTHDAGEMSFDKAQKIGQELFGEGIQAKVIYCTVGLTKTKIISSHLAYLDTPKIALKDFENELIKMKVQIDEISTPNKFVSKATGYIGKRFYTWNAIGQCFFFKTRVPEYDISFNI